MRHREHIYRQLTWNEIDTKYVLSLIELAKQEDTEGAGLIATPKHPYDVTSALVEEESHGVAHLVARKPLILSGGPLLSLVLNQYGEGCQATLHCEDGQSVEKGQKIATVTGPARTLLQAERVMLNFLQRLCGVATLTREYVNALDKASETKLLDTRKTTPGFRVLEKYAFACGGGWTHRIGLYDRVMLKDNHLAVAGATDGNALTEATRKALKRYPDLAIEVEVDRLDQIEPILEAGADIIMLDNFSQDDLAKAVRLINGRAYTEASGGITIETIPQLSHLGLDFISTGAPVHQATWIDIGMDWS